MFAAGDPTQLTVIMAPPSAIYYYLGDLLAVIFGTVIALVIFLVCALVILWRLVIERAVIRAWDLRMSLAILWLVIVGTGLLIYGLWI